jgi:F0F1-type ATP synthase membrane subunit b/b'
MSKNSSCYIEISKDSSIVELNEIYYNCTECSSPIEILSIKDNIIEYNCVNNHHKNFLIEEYINKMKEYSNKDINNDICINHNKKYECYCKDCNVHLCKECLTLRNHINHSKNYIIEVQPNKNELNIIKNIIKYYNNEIERLEIEKINKTKELNEKLQKYKSKIKEKNIIKIKENNNRKTKELKANYEEYKSDIEKIKKRYEEEIKIRKYKYEIKNSEINNKYKLIYENNSSLYINKIEILEKKYINITQKHGYGKTIENMNNIRRLNEIIYNTYNMNSNNYYNSININKLLISYIINNKKNNIFENLLKNEIDNIMKIKSKKDNIGDNNIKELLNKINELEKENEKIKLNYKSKIEKMKKEKETIKHDCVEIITKTIKETNENWKKRLDEIKNKFKNEWNRRETLNKKNIETIIGNISIYFEEIIETKIENYNKEIKDIFGKQINNNIIELNKRNEELKNLIDNFRLIHELIKKDIEGNFEAFKSILDIYGLN